MSESAIKSLLDMGITRDVAIEALSKTNGDVENSVNYIFSGELPQQGPESKPLQPLHADAEQEPQKEEDREDSALLEHTEYASVSNGPLEEPERYRDYTLSTQEEAANEVKNDQDDPLVVKPESSNALFENYFALFCLAVGLGFPHYFLGPDFKDLSYGPDWARGQFLKPQFRIKFETNEDVTIVPRETLTSQDNLTLQPELLWQFQKFLAVQHSPSSYRKQVSARYLTKALEPQVVEKLNNAEHLHDVLPSFIRSLANDVELCPGSQSIKELFISTAYYKPASEPVPIETLVSLLHFMPEEYDSNIYKMFNALLYPNDADDDDDVEETQNSLGNLASMITIVFDEMDESTDDIRLPHGVEVPMKFYPQLYTEDAKQSLIKDVTKHAGEGQQRAHSILKTLNELKSFQGKHIHSFLNSTLDFIARDSSAVTENPQINDLVDTLQHIKQDLSKKKTDGMAEYKAISHKLNNDWNLSHPELGIIEQGEKLGLIDEPYILTTAVISPFNYFIRKRDGQWYHVLGKQHNDALNVAKTDAETVTNTIRLNTRTASETPLMFTYFKESAIDTNETLTEAIEKNTGVTSFAEQDQSSLKIPSTVDQKDLLEL